MALQHCHVRVWQLHPPSVSMHTHRHAPLCVCLHLYVCFPLYDRAHPSCTEKMLMVSGKVKCFLFMRLVVPIRCPRASMLGGTTKAVPYIRVGSSRWSGSLYHSLPCWGEATHFLKKAFVCIWVLIVTTIKFQSGNNFRVGKPLSLKDPNTRHEN